jgi:hypothetical protein
MFAPLPESNGSEQDRFKRFAKAILAVPKLEIAPEQTLSRLEAEKWKVESKIANVRREIMKRKSAKR